MPKPRSSRRIITTATLSVLTGLALAGCSDEGTTPDCPPLPLYDVSDPAALTPAIKQQQAEAVLRGCMTAVGNTGGTGGAGGTGNAR